MPRIFGQEIDKKKAMIFGVVIVGGVAVVVYLRYRAASEAPTGAPVPAQDEGYPGGGGMSVGAPTQGAADAYQMQIDQAAAEAANLANTYQSNLIKQQQTQFDFEQAQMEALAPEYREAEKSRLAVETHQNKTVAKTKIRCPKGQATAGDPYNPGSLYCVPKGSGIPIVSDLIRTGAGLVRGVAGESENIGHQVAQDAYAYAKQTYLPGPTKRKSTPPITGGNVIVSSGPHGYGEI